MSHAISLPVVRFSLAGVLSLLTTFLLFYFMQNLIKNNDVIIIEKPDPVPTFDFVRLQRDETVKKVDRVKPPPEIVDPPPIQQKKPSLDPAVDNTLVDFGKIDNVLPPDHSGPGTLAIGDGDILPVLKVQPNYPASAIAGNIEGYVIVEFTVSTSGTTRDLRVVEANPENIFNRASILAAEKFKYKPRVINGAPVEVTGVRN